MKSRGGTGNSSVSTATYNNIPDGSFTVGQGLLEVEVIDRRISSRERELQRMRGEMRTTGESASQLGFDYTPRQLESDITKLYTQRDDFIDNHFERLTGVPYSGIQTGGRGIR